MLTIDFNKTLLRAIFIFQNFLNLFDSFNLFRLVNTAMEQDGLKDSQPLPVVDEKDAPPVAVEEENTAIAPEDY